MELITKKCPNCGAGIDTDCTLETTVCLYCDSKVYVKRTPKNNDSFILCVPKKRGMPILAKTMLVIFAVIGVLFITFFIIAVSDSESDGSTGRERNTAGEISVRTVAPDAGETYNHNLGDTFIFDNFEITFGNSIKWVERDLSDSNDPESFEYFIKIPVTLTNNSGETRRFEWVRLTVYGSAGTALSRHYFPRYRDDIEDLRDMRDGATASGMYLYFPYDGDADYFIEINSSNEAKREITIKVVKSDSVFEQRVGSEVIFNDWEILIGDTVEWLKGELSEESHPNSRTYMVRVPVTITNKGDETRSFAAFTVNIYSATGLQLSRILNMNYEDSIFNQGNNMPVGATESNIYIYFPYDGEGDYFISFSWLNIPAVEVKINIGQPD